MARRYPDDDPLRHLSSHSVALTVGLSVQRHHQHEIPMRENISGVFVTTGALDDTKLKLRFTCDGGSFTSGRGSVCPSSSCYLLWSH